jgi:hypothetical protein
MRQRSKIPKFGARLFSPIEACKIGRASAAASITRNGNVDDFLRALGTTTEVPKKMKQDIQVALARFADVRREYEEIMAQWEAPFGMEGSQSPPLLSPPIWGGRKGGTR